MHKSESQPHAAPTHLSGVPSPQLAYSPGGSAQALGISRSKLYELIAAGQLKVVKLGSRTLILHSELVRFLATLDAA
jgi:excisionase family DNA binding protein